MSQTFPKKILFDNFLSKAQKKFDNKYDYSQVTYISCKNPITIICPEHGKFIQTPEHHYHSKFGCPKCSIKTSHQLQKSNSKEFASKALIVHNKKYSYEKVVYIRNNIKVTIICPEHGDFNQTPANHLMGKGCPYCKFILLRKKFSFDKDFFIKNANKKFNNQFDYSLTQYINCDTPVVIKCRQHGLFSQTPFLHLKSKFGCPQCYATVKGENRRKPNIHFLKILTNKFSKDFQYKIIRNKKEILKIELTCPKHGKHIYSLSNLLQSYLGCKKCSISDSSGEIKLKNFFKKYNLSFQSNIRNKISPYELDIYIPSKNLAIEFNGIYWHSELAGKNRQYHLDKLLMCQEKNINLIQIFENELINSPKIVFSRLKNILGLNSYSVFARKCLIKEINCSLKSKFVNKYHLQGDTNSLINLGLFYKNRLVSVMTFCKLRKALGNKKTINNFYELLRFCSISNFNIIGGASKLLSYFENKYQPKSIISYADLRWSTGKLYKILGFKFIHNSKPNYWYFENIDKLYHRFNFRKQVLNKKLKSFDPKLSEWKNMKNNGWNRIWDCGNMVFEKLYE